MVWAYFTVKFVYVALLFNFQSFDAYCFNSSQCSTTISLTRWPTRLICQITINFWLSASNWYLHQCLLAVSAGPATPCVVKSFCFQWLDSRCQWNGTARRLTSLPKSITASLRRRVAIRFLLSVSRAASCCPHHTTFVTDLRHPLSTCQQLTAV